MDEDPNLHALQREVEEIAAALEIKAPSAVETSVPDLTTWCTWWRASAETARRLTPADRTRLKAGGWWPLASAAHIGQMPPEIVQRTTRPGLLFAIPCDATRNPSRP